MLHIDHLRLAYGRRTVLHDISLTVAEGEFLALLGPSGCGKTSLLRSIAGLERPQAGHIVYGEQNLDALPVHERGMGMVFQSYALFAHKTVAQNIAFGLHMQRRGWWGRRSGPSDTDIQRRVEELLDVIQLADYAQVYPSQLSGGQRQRVALARALAPRPRALLLDEPLSALDAHVRGALRRWLKELHRQLGLTTLLVTHDQAEAFALADRVAVMNEGRLEQLGTPRELRERPASSFVETFLAAA